MATQPLDDAGQGKVWTIAEAKARLSEILRLAEREGPQRIGVRKTFVIVPEDGVRRRDFLEERMPMGQYLLEKMPRGTYDKVPRERGSNRPIPFADWTEEQWADFDANDPVDP